MIVMQKFDDFLKEQLKDPELKSEYDLLESKFDKLQKRIDKSDFSYMKLIKGKTFYAKGGITTRYMIVDYDSDGNVWAINANSKNKVYRRVYKFTDVELTKNYEW